MLHAPCDPTTNRGGGTKACPAHHHGQRAYFRERAALLGDAGWFHGHFGASKEALRVLAFLGGYPRRVKGIPGVDWWGLNLDIKQGGHTIEYRDEDPHIRKMFQEQLAKEGAEFNMPEEVYR